MSHIFPAVDPDGLLEYSVVYTDRSLNHMSAAFQQIMRGISTTLKTVYQAHAVALVPGGGTFGMEAVARQFATGQTCLVLRNGWFSYRWTQIFEMGGIPKGHTVLKAQLVRDEAKAPFAPADLGMVVSTILKERPAVVFAPHVETSSGILLPDTYLRSVADAVHQVGGLFVLDAVASGALWVDMPACGVDVLISAPQKGWSGSPGAAFVLLSELANQRLAETRSTSFACDLLKWRQVMATYEGGGHTYHATMPTDALAASYKAMQEMAVIGFATLTQQQLKLGTLTRQLMTQYGYPSVAAPGFTAPGVIVSYTDDDEVHKGSAFVKLGLQTAVGVPLMCDEPAEFKTFRVGMFGLDKLANIEGTVARLRQALDQLAKR